LSLSSSSIAGGNTQSAFIPRHSKRSTRRLRPVGCAR
jgi:hypothetical protein